MTEQLTNNASGNLNATITAGAASLTLLAGQGAAFPATGNFRLIADAEIMLCTARAGDVLTVTRAQEGTSAASHAAGAAVVQALTKGGLDQYLVERYVGIPAGLASGEVPVWNGSSFVRSSVTRIGPSSLGSGTPDATKFLRGDGSWAVPSGGAFTPVAARIYTAAGGATAITNATFVTMPLPTLDFQTVTMNGTANSLVVPAGGTGKYTVAVNIQYNAAPSVTSLIRLLVNGAAIPGVTFIGASTAGVTQGSAPGYSDIIALTAGDVVSVQMWQNAGGTLYACDLAIARVA